MPPAVGSKNGGRFFFFHAEVRALLRPSGSETRGQDVDHLLQGLPSTYASEPEPVQVTSGPKSLLWVSGRASARPLASVYVPSPFCLQHPPFPPLPRTGLSFPFVPERCTSWARIAQSSLGVHVNYVPLGSSAKCLFCISCGQVMLLTTDLLTCRRGVTPPAPVSEVTSSDLSPGPNPALHTPPTVGSQRVLSSRRVISASARTGSASFLTIWQGKHGVTEGVCGIEVNTALKFLIIT